MARERERVPVCVCLYIQSTFIKAVERRCSPTVSLRQSDRSHAARVNSSDIE